MNTARKAAAEVYLAPGDFRFATCPTRLRTILGSCVAITLWHPERKIGAMCHFMLPSRLRCSTALNGMYADEAIELFVREARAHRTDPEDYQLKLFGGGEMFPELQREVPFGDVARLNINAALEMAALYRLDLIAQDLGSTGYRSIIFDLCNGDVWVRHQPIRTRH
ncbi:chemoreceptor glutamine deamidase CheD [Pseudomonas sp. AF32]|uniref:chemoreceptor glutamine deamidase CheD n=1 Tax=Pseudomonas sp. AF32 TaxID=554390 RepID=UPI001EEDC851|nr:chemoreceptor glutamine deamidase CheD [Pseudomonas sp. AF32]MCG6574411.1 chemoreceptor glutamine deamidase CheD [Pseudomonas sp. AF32]